MTEVRKMIRKQDPITVIEAVEQAFPMSNFNPALHGRDNFSGIVQGSYVIHHISFLHVRGIYHLRLLIR
jgi:hypothetical protein